MNPSDQATQARAFQQLNRDGGLLLPNAWDAASARIFEAAGFPAIGTTSARVAYARGLPDAQRIGREAMIAEIASICRAVGVPVTADIEAGYGPTPADVHQTVDAALDVGVVGINLEDNAHGSAPGLFSLAEQVKRIGAARAAGVEHGVDLMINARTDTFLLGLGEDAEARLAMTIERGRAYLAAGADMIFIPLLADPAIIELAAKGVAGPISLMAMPGAPPARSLFAAGASRVSLGQTAMLASMKTVKTVAEEFRNGNWGAITNSFYGFAEAEALFTT